MALRLAYFVLLSEVVCHLSNAQPYTVTGEKLPGCNSKLSVEKDGLVVSRGIQDALCTGYVKYDFGGGDIRRICASSGGDFHESIAQRVCFTLGLDMDRKAEEEKGVRLYRCDGYYEDNIANPVGTGSTENVAYTRAINNHLAKRCDYDGDQAGFKCFDDCYFNSETPQPEDNTNNCNDAFWAITCSDINECVEGSAQECNGPFDGNCKWKAACGPNTACKNLVGSYECSCLAGYTGTGADPYDEDKGCVDIDECASGDICGENGVCRNALGSYECDCVHPDLWDKETRMCGGELCGLPITDLNASRTDALGLPNEEVKYTCHNGFRTATDLEEYTNICQNGDWVPGGLCTDVDECLASPCDNDATCVNLPGTFFCRCNEGFTGDGGRCEVYYGDPCIIRQNLGLCVNGACSVIEDKANCICDVGFSGAACDVDVVNPALIVAIVGLIFLVIFMIAIILYCSSRVLSTSRSTNLLNRSRGAYIDPIYGRPRPPLPLAPYRGRFF